MSETRLFGLPPGVDFAAELVRGMDERFPALHDVTLVLNTRRMQRRVTEVLARGPARLLPRMRLVADLGLDPLGADLPLPVPPLRRRLELARLIARLLDRSPDMAPRAALFDLADSLARLMDEAAGEGVSAEAIRDLDISDQSGHWERTRTFLAIVQEWQTLSGGRPAREARQRAAVERLVAHWAEAPPDGPVIVAGSTGSRGATAALLAAVARLPQGAVVLPGFDFDLPGDVWDGLSDAMTAEDHPQFRFRRLADMLGVHPGSTMAWTTAAPPDPARNRLISLSLRPAPVTDQWLRDGPLLGPLVPATAGLTLIEAASPRDEAECIALRLRAAVEEGRRAALITPDRGLTRQVEAALDRWDIKADDSAGVPLPQTPPGRLLRQVADLMGRPVTGTALMALLKHPLSGAADRGAHLLAAHRLELELRRNGPAYPDGVALRAFAQTDWADWLAGMLDRMAACRAGPLPDLVARHQALAEALAAGPGTAGAGGLWDQSAGRAARALMAEFAAHADQGPDLTPQEYAALFAGALRGVEVRSPDDKHPQVLIWGTIEARVGGADLVILGGMNDGSWPEAATPDPWLNRALRVRAGLLLPERRIGLAAHDYTLGMAAPEVWITRATRSADAQTVPSRWINRLTNLLEGLKEQDGPQALAAMRARGAGWLAAAAGLSTVARAEAATRPSPRPPVQARPAQLAVTDLSRLYRDPYAIYARRILRLKPLDPLMPSADAMMRGTVVHAVLERFMLTAVPPDAPDARARLMAVAEEVLSQVCPWPTVQRLWLATIDRAADWFLTTEAERQQRATPAHFETWGRIDIAEPPMTLVAKADRIDETAAGEIILYDYKTGDPPSTAQQRVFDKQLLVEAAMAERGAFAAVGPVPVLAAEYVALTKGKVLAAPLAEMPPDQVWEELLVVLRNWQDPGRGYTARRAVFTEGQEQDYDHLSRFGEWDVTDAALPEDLT